MIFTDKKLALLDIISRDENLTDAQMAVMTGITEAEVAAYKAQLEADGIIVGTHTMINWDKTGQERVVALIELKVTPQYGEGFDRIAERLWQYDQVKSVYLMSGAYDILVEVEGSAMKEVALFAAERIAPMDFVVSQNTSFVLRKYKENGIVYDKAAEDDRQVVL